MIQFQLDDTIKTRVIDQDQKNNYVTPPTSYSAQLETISGIRTLQNKTTPFYD